MCVDDKRCVNWVGWEFVIYIMSVGRCVLNRELGVFCDGRCVYKEVFVCDGEFGMCVYVCMFGVSRRGV